MGGVAVVRRVSLAASFDVAGRARLLLRDLADTVGGGGWLDAGELACAELISNAVLHAHTTIELMASASAHELVVEVRDRSPVLPVPRSYGSYATTGRGMALVAALVSEHGIKDGGPAGKTAWFLVRADPGDSDLDEADLLAAWDDATASGVWDISASTAAPLPGQGGTPEQAHPAEGVVAPGEVGR